jgi:hypothetical protein
MSWTGKLYLSRILKQQAQLTKRLQEKEKTQKKGGDTMPDVEKAKSLIPYFEEQLPGYTIEFRYVTHMRFEYRFIQRGKIQYRVALSIDLVDKHSTEEIIKHLEEKDWKVELEKLDPITNTTAYFGED